MPVYASAFNVSSDITLKKDINAISNDDYSDYLSQIRSIESITYRYNEESATVSDNANGIKLRETPHIGFSAQSLPKAIQTHIPTSGKVDAELKLGYNLSDMAGLTLVGIKAVDHKQQLMEEKMNAQDQKINDMLQVIEALKAELAAIKNSSNK